MKRPAPERRPVIDHVNAKIAHIVFYELHQRKLPGNDTLEGVIDYGDPHPDTDTFPDHKLVMVSPHEGDEDGWYRWYYAADHANQDDYNFDIEYPYNGDTNFPRYIRTYVVPREGYTAEVLGAASPEGGKLILEKMFRSTGDQRIDSLYVRVVRVYDDVPLISETEDLDRLKLYGYQVTYPFGSLAYPRVTWRFPIEVSLFSANAAADLSACPVAGYTGLKLTDRGMEPLPDADGVGIVTRIYDTVPGPVLTETKKVGDGREIPPEFRVTGDITQAVAHNLALPVTPDTPAGDPLAAGAILESTANPVTGVIGQKLTTTFAGSKSPVSGYKLDPHTGELYPYTRELVPAGTAGVALDASGVVSEVDPINPYWSVKTTRKTTALQSRSWWSHENYYWPPVLDVFNFSGITRRGNPDYIDGYVTHYRLKDAYNGPCKTEVLEEWSNVPFAASTPLMMIPEAMVWEGPLTRGAIPRCLHPEIEFTETTGTTHPRFAYLVATFTFAATNFTDWPATISQQTVSPFQGGYRRVTYTHYKPV